MVRNSAMCLAVFASLSVLANAKKPQIAEASPRLYNPPIRQMALFESATAFVDREIEPDMLNAGVFWMQAPFNPIYGTLYVNSSRALELTTKLVDLETPNLMPLDNPAVSFANREVTVFLRDENKSVINGTMLPAAKDKDGNLVNSCIRIKDKTTGRISFLQPGWITRIDAADYASDKLASTPVLEFKKNEKLPANSSIGYLTEGLYWSPEYQLLLSKDSMSIEMAATVSNKLEDIKDAETYFVLGSPNIYHQKNLSPMAFNSLYSPVQNLGRSATLGVGIEYDRFDTMRKNVKASADEFTPEAQSSTGDVVYLSGGKITMDKGDSRRISLAFKDNVKYERIVEVEIASQGDAFGRPANYNNQRKSSIYSCFDAIRFSNPLEIPISNAAVSIYEEGRFVGETAAKWCNPNEQTTIRIAKAESIGVDLKSIESEGSRKEEVSFYGNRYLRVDAVATIKLRNFRKEAAKVQAKYILLGKVIDAPEGKAITLMMDDYGVNAQNEISYDLSLPADSEKVFTVKYQVYIRY